MFKSLTNALGLNTLKVDTILDQPVVMVGDRLSGTVHITGTSHDKHINHITLHLETLAEKDTDHGDVRQTHVLGSVRLLGQHTLKAEERLSLPFELTLSAETPITQVSCRHNQSKLWLRTELDVAGTLDSSDKDYITTTPTPTMARFLTAMEQAGFSMHKCDVEIGYLNTTYGSSNFGCYQEFEYSGRGFSLNSVEVSFLPKDGYTHVVLEIDRAFRSDSYQLITLNDTMSVADMMALIRQRVGV
ncbi:MAG: sporulation protein [Moraxella sp.]|nr:sporulation protein [Moraxella sp.]